MADPARLARPGSPRFVVIRTRGYAGLAAGASSRGPPLWVGVYDRAYQRVVWETDTAGRGGLPMAHNTEYAEARARVACSRLNATAPDGYPSIRRHG